MKFNILDLLLPRETKFYAMLNKQADTLLQASREFRFLVTNLQEGNTDATLRNLVSIRELEKAGYKIERSVIDELDKTFERNVASSIAFSSSCFLSVRSTS